MDALRALYIPARACSTSIPLHRAHGHSVQPLWQNRRAVLVLWEQNEPATGNDFVMDFITLLLPVLLIIGLFAALVVLKRRLFSDGPTQAPIPIPDIAVKDTIREPASAAPPVNNGPPARPVDTTPGPADSKTNEVSLTPARLYPGPVLLPAKKAVFSRLLQSLPGYVVLPGITYDQFLEARDGTPSENTSLQNRAAQQRADFVICDKKLNVLLVCQLEDGTVQPARIQEREKMLNKAGIRLLRWKTDRPPDPAKLLNTVQTLEKLKAQAGNPAS